MSGYSDFNCQNMQIHGPTYSDENISLMHSLVIACSLHVPFGRFPKSVIKMHISFEKEISFV